MVRKNYLSREEQEVWSYIEGKETVDNELVGQIFPDWIQNRVNKVLSSLCKKGYLERAKRNLYYNPLLINDFHSLALKVRGGYIGLSSALKYYGLLDYEDFTIFVITRKFQKKMELKGTKYSIWFIPLGDLFFGYEKKRDIYVSSLEKTFFDCFLKPREVGYSALTKSIYDSKIDWKKFIDLYKMTDNSSLSQRTGYILELMKGRTNIRIPPFVFECLLKKVNTPVKLIASGGNSKFNGKWKVQDNLGEENILSWWNQ